MTSIIPFKGYGKGAVSFRGVFAGHITGSGNYFDFFVPVTIPKTASVSLSIEDARIYISDSSFAYTAGNFDLSYLNLINYGIGIKVEIKFVNQQTLNISGTINLVGTLTIT